MLWAAVATLSTCAPHARLPTQPDSTLGCAVTQFPLSQSGWHRSSSSASVLARWPSQDQLSYAIRSALAVLKESRPLMTVSQARDTLGRMGSTPLQLPRGVSSTSTLSRTVSSTWSVPRSYQPSAQSCSGAKRTTLLVPGRSTQTQDSVEVSEDPFQVSSSVPGCSVLLRAPHTHRLGEGGCVD